MNGAPIGGTSPFSEKPNQTKIFYHAGNWWGVFHEIASGDWKIWRRDALGDWTPVGPTVDTRNSCWPDCVMDRTNNKLHVFTTGTATTGSSAAHYHSFDYAAGTWTRTALQASAGVEIPSMNTTTTNEACMCLGHNGTLYVSAQSSSAIKCSYSTNNGVNWSDPPVTVKSVGEVNGLTDVISFLWNGEYHIGIACGENGHANGGTYHFLRCREALTPTAGNWVDESSSLTDAGGDTDNHVSMQTDGTGSLYIAYKNAENGAAGDPAAGVWARTGAGPTWAQHDAVLNNEALAVTRSWMILDDRSHEFYFGFTNGSTDTRDGIAYKKCAIDNLPSLQGKTRHIIIDNPVGGSTMKFNDSGVGADDPSRPTQALIYAQMAVITTGLPHKITCATINTSTDLTSAGLFDLAELYVGMGFTGTGIPSLTEIVAINSTSSITMSHAATATGAPVVQFTGTIWENLLPIPDPIDVDPAILSVTATILVPTVDYEQTLAPSTMSVAATMLPVTVILGATTASRALWLFEPDAGESIVEEYGYITTVLGSYRNVEQRIKLKRSAVGSIEFGVTFASKQEAQRANALLYRFHASPWIVPLWHYATRLSETAAPGSVELMLDTDGVPFYDPALNCAYALLWRSSDSWEVVTMSEIYPDKIVLSSTTSGNWPVGEGWLLPARTGYLDTSFDGTWFSSALYGCRLRFEFLRNAAGTPVQRFGYEYAIMGGMPESVPIPFPAPELEMYLGFPVLKVAPDGIEPRVDSVSRDFTLTGSSIGKLYADDHAGVSGSVRQYQWTGVGGLGVAEIKQFLDHQFGRLLPFWLPSYEHDVEIIATHGSGATSLTIKSISYAENMLPGSGARKYLAFIPTAGGTMFFRRVLYAIDNGDGTETLSLDQSLGQVVTTTAWTIGFLRFCRLDDDKVQIAFDGRNYAAVKVRVREIPREAPT